MPHADLRRRPSLRRSLVPALVLSLLPLATAIAETPYVRITREATDIRLTQYGRSRLITTVQQGDVLEVLHIDGDRYAYRTSNWYWVLLPPDLTGVRLAGWVRGNLVEHAPPPPAAASTPRTGSVDVQHERGTAGFATAPSPTGTAESTTAGTARSTRAASETTPAVRAVVPEVVVHFPFDRSDLTDGARSALAGAVQTMKTNVSGMSLVLEGHADATGPEGYNDRLGRARAESVRRYMADHLQVPADTINVVSYGERNPLAPNTTREGRALNRRVVIKVGG